jgi:Uncharacterized protein conserved in bacteria
MITNQFTTQPFTPRQWEKTVDGFLRVKSRVLAERVMPYVPQDLSQLPEDLQTTPVINMFVDRASMSTGEAFRSLEAAQVTAPEHIWVTPENDGVSKGNAVGTPCMEGPYLTVDLLVTDPTTIQDIEEGRIGEISAGYHADTIFESGEFEGTPYHAKQTQLRFNHIAIIPYGTGRAGSDVRIINQQPQNLQEGETNMADQKIVRVQLRNTKRFVNVDEDGAAALAAEDTAAAETTQLNGKKLEDLMQEAEEARAAADSANAQLEELRGELSVYKEKLDELLSTEAIEHAAEQMIEETGEAEAIIENAFSDDADDQKKKEEVMNSIKGVYGSKLHNSVLSGIGVKVENMSPEALRGAFKAQAQIANQTKGRKVVVGTKLMNGAAVAAASVPAQRTARERLGLK